MGLEKTVRGHNFLRHTCFFFFKMGGGGKYGVYIHCYIDATIWNSVGMYPQKVNVPFWQVVSHMIFASMVVIGNTYYYALLSFYLQTVHSIVCG